MTTKRMTILLADDHDVVLEGLRRILDRPEFEVVGAVRDGWALVESASRLRPELIVVDVSMPGLNGIEAARQIARLGSKATIIFLSMHAESSYAAEAITAGGAAYVLKEAAGRELLKAIEEARKGRIYFSPTIAERAKRALELRRHVGSGAADELTSRQHEVLQLLAEGKTPKEIAGMLNVSARTVEFHKYRIMEILGLKNIAELTTYAVRKGIVT